MPDPQAQTSTGPDSGGLGGIFSSIGGSLGKLFSGKSAIGAGLLMGIMLLFGFDDPMALMAGGLIGALVGSGVGGDMLSGGKNLVSSLFGGKSNGNQPQQQQQVAQGGPNQQQAAREAAQIQNQMRGQYPSQNMGPNDNVSAPTIMPYNYDPVNHRGMN